MKRQMNVDYTYVSETGTNMNVVQEVRYNAHTLYNALCDESEIFNVRVNDVITFEDENGYTINAIITEWGGDKLYTQIRLQDVDTFREITLRYRLF